MLVYWNDMFLMVLWETGATKHNAELTNTFIQYLHPKRIYMTSKCRLNDIGPSCIIDLQKSFIHSLNDTNVLMWMTFLHLSYFPRLYELFF